MKKAVVELELYLPRKNSVRYKAVGSDPALTSIYLMRTAIQGEAPKKVRVTIEEVKE